MHLITMAHLGEAQGVIEKFKLQRIDSDLFKNEELVLVLTGEGPFEASIKTSLMLGKFPISKVINLGIAGALNAELKVGEIYPIRTHYLVQDMRPAFKSFVSAEKGEDCLTTFERILDADKARALRGMGGIVDREAWGSAYAAKSAGIPFESYKLISDIAGTVGACELVRDHASEFSMKLALYLGTVLTHKESVDEIVTLPGFHFTFTSGHRFKALLTKLSIKYEVSSEELLKTLNLDEIRESISFPKDRAKVLLEKMESKLDPFREKLKASKEKWTSPFTKVGISIETDPNWENKEVTLRFSVASDSELKSKLDTLNKLSLVPFSELMEGKLDVE
ncbi:hypothetical protein ACJVC5_14875 [Peredibacter sp. HCB2-198]|uniref:5'-methylthioadenosine/S-adenosylhomocysteine nucleosidase family protein n=1 Tax=Peredibacter sp. HCB2-198 TaxID=3383025 RepID=UPI0038B4E577